MSQSKVRIAVVDDEPSVAKLIARVLRMHDYEVWVAPDCKTLILRLHRALTASIC